MESAPAFTGNCGLLAWGSRRASLQGISDRSTSHQTVFRDQPLSKRRVGVLLAALDRHLSGDLTFGVSGLMSDPFNTVCYEVQLIRYKGY